MSVPVVAWLVSHALVEFGIRPLPATVAECWGLPGAKTLERVQAITGLSELSGRDAAKELLRICINNASYRGSDVRMTTGTLHNPNCWPRRPIEANLFRWRVVVAYKLTGKHINALELQAALATLKWRLRSSAQVRRRWVHLLDSQVCIAVIVKGRSSSRLLTSILRRYNALMLMGSCQGFYAYVRTHENPADAPSRW